MPLASIPDLLRLVAVPVLGWAAVHDIRTRRVSNRTWPPLAALAAVLLVWDGLAAWNATAPFAFRLFAIRTVLSLVFVIPLAYLFWRLGGFGGADAKAFMVIAVLFPTFPTYQVAGLTLPIQHTTLGVFSLTILTNTVLVAALYPFALFVYNALSSRFSRVMVVGLPVRWDSIETTHGRLLQTAAGFTRGGLDLDALRMYLTWRGATLAEIRDDAARLRDPASLPAEPSPPGDGAVLTDGGERSTASRTPKDECSESFGSERERSERESRRRAKRTDGDNDSDPWGAAAFLDSIDGSAYGTTPEQLREGLDLLATEDEVWVSPGIPFIVPLFVGLLVALTYGDLLFAAMGAIGLV